jgi:hypothetical protein
MQLGIYIDREIRAFVRHPNDDTVSALPVSRTDDILRGPFVPPYRVRGPQTECKQWPVSIAHSGPFAEARAEISCQVWEDVKSYKESAAPAGEH